jgi:malate dehydrogenase
MLRLDHNRALSQLSKKTGRPVDSFDKLMVWGNHSPTMYPDVRFATSGGQSVKALINDEAWIKDTFITTVAKRGAAILEARGLSSAASAANAAIDHMRDWWLGAGSRWVTMGVPSNGDYGIPRDVVFGFPTICSGDGRYEIVKGLEMDEFSKNKMNATLKELEEEREAIKGMLG